jgi:hypothetical protein
MAIRSRAGTWLTDLAERRASRIRARDVRAADLKKDRASAASASPSGELCAGEADETLRESRASLSETVVSSDSPKTAAQDEHRIERSEQLDTASAASGAIKHS